MDMAISYLLYYMYVKVFFRYEPLRAGKERWGGMPTVSIIVPIYNCAKYLGRCLESILKQTFHDLQVICIDDGSTDDSYSVALRYRKLDRRVSCYKNDINKGQSYARNVGLAKAKGKYVLFVDSDDWLMQDAVKIAVAHSAANDLDILYFNFQSVYEDDIAKETCQIISEERKKAYEVCNGEKLFLDMITDGEYRSMVYLAIYKREFLSNHKLCFYNGIIHEDELFSYKAILSAKRAAYIPQKLYIYYRRNGSTMNDEKKLLKRLKSDLIIYYEMQSFYFERKFTGDVCKAIGILLYNTYSRIRNHYAKMMNSDCEAGEVEFSDIRYQVMWNSIKNMICGTFWMNINNALYSAMKNANKLIIFGAGSVARNLINYLELRGFGNFDIAVSKNQGNMYIYGKKVQAISDLVSYKSEACVCVATMEKYHQEIRKYLTNLGFVNVIFLK